MTNRRGILVLFPLFAMSFNHSAPAQSQETGPALGVARLSLAKGDVTVQRGESGDSIQATVNMPLVEADILTAGPASRAEVQLDYSNFLRLNELSEARLANLAHRTFRIQLERGVVTYSELRGGDADVDIETPLAAVRPEKNGRYRVEVVGLDRVTVTVRKGRAEVASAHGSETLKSGQRMIVRKGDQGIEFQVAKADPRDDWDLWNSHRDRQLMKSKAYHYVHTSVYGVEDLDGHGDWVYVPSFGRCWFPSVSVGWAPYRYGRWSWLDYYGWTWVSHDPWGWAPYHYGRWFRHARYGWGWYPGSYYSRHRWRPALVAFFGFGGRGGLGIGLGSRYGYYGWIPLAPGEPYHPWYGRRSRYGRGRSRGGSTVLVNNRINIYNSYRNARHRNGTTLVAARHFSRGQILNARALQASEVRRASLMRGRIPVVPDRASQGQLVRRDRRLPRNPGSNIRSRFFSTDRARRNVTRRSFVQQRQEMVRFVDSMGGSDTQATRPTNARSSVRSEAGRSAPGLRPQRTTATRSTAGTTNRRSLRAPSSSATVRGRNNVDRSPREPANPQRPAAARPDGGSRSNSLERWRHFNRRGATQGTIPRGAPSASSPPRPAESVSQSSPSVPSVPSARPSPRFAPRSSSRVSAPSPSSSSRSSSRVRSAPSTSRPSPSVSRPSSRSSPSYSSPSRSSSSSSSRSSSRVSSSNSSRSSSSSRSRSSRSSGRSRSQRR
ncbi:MAG: hypothetical protein OXI92_00670 [Acidobacteriota bacterium]|nr:hypothetical protein [Acidobacteriota bacterium]